MQGRKACEWRTDLPRNLIANARTEQTVRPRNGFRRVAVQVSP
jgi:hypothetical protein